MSLLKTAITKATPKAPKGIICGPPGCGKTTFGASAPKSIIIDCENGANAINANRTPYLATWPEMHAWLTELLNGKHDYKTIVIDTLDWLMRRLEEHVAGSADNPAQTLNKSHGGYGNGKQALKNYVYLQLLPMLDKLVCNGTAVILLAHVSRSELTDVDGITMEKTIPALNKDYLETFTEWSDFVATVRYGNDNNRELVTTETPGILAKNRYTLPAIMPFTWEAFSGSIKDYQQKTFNK